MTNPQNHTQAELLKPLWKKIWKLSMTCKIRNFLWKACKNAIPTMTNLLRHNVVNDPSCSLCAQHNEDVLHSLWSCPNLAQVWNEDPQWSFREQTTFQDFLQLLLHGFESGCSVELFAMRIWTIWYQRNKAQTAPPGFPLKFIAQ